MSYSIALVHEYFNQFGGAERVLLKLCRLYPNAPIFTLFITRAMKKQLPPEVVRRIRPSFLQYFPEWMLNKRVLFPLYPIAIEQHDLREYTIVLSSSSAYAKGILTTPLTTHICYCHSPMRYIWDWYHNYLDEHNFKKIPRFVISWILHHMRWWDYISSKRVDLWLANSNHVRERIKKYYGHDSTVLYPPVPVCTFSQYCLPTQEKKGKYFLLVSRLSAYKHIDQAIQACNRINIQLKIVGTGKEEAKLRKFAGKTVEFLGRVSDEELIELYVHAQALLFPGEEDFGLAMVEAIATGCPVIAYSKGGAREIVIDGVNGILFHEPTIEGIQKGITKFYTITWDSGAISQSVAHFDEKIFEEKISNMIETIIKNQQGLTG